MKEVFGEKCISSPKQPHDSILPYSEGLKIFIPVRYKKNESRKNDKTLPDNIKSRLVINSAANNSIEQIIIDAST